MGCMFADTDSQIFWACYGVGKKMSGKMKGVTENVTRDTLVHVLSKLYGN